MIPGAERWQPLRDWLSAIPGLLPQRPDAIVVVSAHWLEDKPTVTVKTNTSLLYDYGGFPPETYSVEPFYIDGKVPASSPAVAKRIVQLLKEADFDAQEDDKRDFDHG